MLNYTDKQKEAIYKDGCNILVAAAAGSGKTAVLTERIIQKVIDSENSTDIDSLLIVTFTDAATSEMRQRISAGLENAFKQSEKKDPKQAEYILKQINLLNKAYISTIDSFCFNVVRKNFNTLDIDPNFKIIDDDENNIIKEEVLDNLLEELYEKNDECFVRFINFFSDNYSKNTDSNVKKVIFEIYKLMQSMPNPMQWLNDSVENFNIKKEKNIFNTKWTSYFVEDLFVSIDNIELLNCELLDFFYLYSTECAKLIEFFEKLKKYIDFYRDILKNDLENYQKIIENSFDVGAIRLSFGKLDISNETKKRITNTKATLKSCLEKFYSDLNYFSGESQKMIKNTYPIMKTLEYILKEFSERFFNEKKEKFIFSFNDISHLALKVLADENGMPTAAAKEFQEKFDEIISDEYQDISELQEAILSLISRNSSNRFMVGDIKQCIYGFRLANPKLFAEKYSLYTKDFEKSKENGYKIDLYDNFRSRSCVLSAINFIFRQIMTKNFCGIEYDENAALHYGANYPLPTGEINISNCAEFELINSDKDDDDELDDDIKEASALELEATVIADKIENMMNNEKLHIYDKGLETYRPLQYKDIVILARSSKKISTAIQNVFTKKSIPFSAKVKSEYFNNLEIATILSFLSILDNPYQDIELFTVLHSPVYSFTFDELVKIKTAFPEKYFYSALLFYITAQNKNIDNEIVYKINMFLRDFEKWREFSLNSTINELLQTIYDDTDYYNYVGIFPDGDLRRMNLKILQEKAIQFENTNSKGIFKFMKYIDKIKKASVSNDTNVFYESDNVVTITNIHQSKGLEYPVVFVCDLDRAFNFDNFKQPVDQELGIGVKYKDILNNAKYNTISQRAIAIKRKNDILSEEIRLLYVALTRAKEKLILVGNLKKFEKTIEGFVKYTNTPQIAFPLAFLKNSSSFIRLIIACLARHKSGEILRKFFPNNERINRDVYNDSSNWKINIIDCKSLGMSKNKTYNEKEERYTKLHSFKLNEDYSGLKKEIARRLLWVYPNCEIQNIPLTISISEIKRRAYEEEEYIPKNLSTPDFIKEYIGLSAAQKGTAVHTLMEHIDFKKDYDLIALKNYTGSLVEKNILSRQEGDSINIKKILSFLSSDIAKRIRKSNNVYKESPFVIGIKPSEIFGLEYADADNYDNKILVHGIIDLYFEEGENIILLDYKTDYIKNNDINAIAEKYRVQIELYKKALELSTGKTVSEFGFYLFGADSYLRVGDELCE